MFTTFTEVLSIELEGPFANFRISLTLRFRDQVPYRDFSGAYSFMTIVGNSRRGRRISDRDYAGDGTSSSSSTFYREVWPSRGEADTAVSQVMNSRLEVAMRKLMALKTEIENDCQCNISSYARFYQYKYQ